MMAWAPVSSSEITEKPLDREKLLEFFSKQIGPCGKREIKRHFQLDSADGSYITRLLRDLEKDGLLKREGGRRYILSDHLPSIIVVDITAIDEEGNPVLVPTRPDFAALNHFIRLTNDKRHGSAPGVGDRLLVKLFKKKDQFWGRTIRRLERNQGKIFGLVREHTGGGRIEPVSRKRKGEFLVAQENLGGAKEGDLVSCEVLEGRVYGLPLAKVTEIIAHQDDPRAIGDLVLALNEIPIAFSKEVLESIKITSKFSLDGRKDFRETELVTIDGEDARDFDDAVYATPLQGGTKGWRILVAIADVSHYVPMDSALDHAAQDRGNSVYLPDRVVPMLPEELSNGVCSLVPGAERYCIAVEIDISEDGEKLSHSFHRGLMRSAARLTYEQLQEAKDNGHKKSFPIGDERVDALYGAYQALHVARKERGAIDLEIPERRIILDEKGSCSSIRSKNRLDSHRLIEEFMILANICAGESLVKHGWPCMFRVHENPALDRIESLRGFLKTLGLSLKGGQSVRPKHFSNLLTTVMARKDARGIQDAILRTQAQAIYSPENIGHFGLALNNYAHFTSPIRRYSDLLVHRALIGAHSLGPDKIEKGSTESLETIGKHISMTERRAALAERDAFDRYSAALLSGQLGKKTGARITGVERFGLFVELDEFGSDALLPISELGRGRFRFDEKSRALIGPKQKVKYSLGDQLSVFIKSADKQTGSISVSLFSSFRNSSLRNARYKKQKPRR